MNLASTLEFNGQLDAVVTRANGVVEDHGTIGNSTISLDDAWKRVKNSKPFWNRLYLEVRDHMPLIFGAAALASAFYGGHLAAGQLALVTTAGINLLAADFVSGAGTHISAFTYVDFGTGVSAAAIGDTALGTPAGTARVSGTQSTPSAGQYRVVGTVSFTSSLAITEFGLFSASTVGTLWDRRVFAALNVSNGDSITATYTLTTTAGGS